MNFRVSSIISALFFFITLAAATGTVTLTTHAPYPTPPPASQCNTGELYCCNNVQAASSGGLAVLWTLIGIVVDPITALIGTSCSPIDLLAISANSCSAQPVCCQNNNFYSPFGVVLGCDPVNLNL
ncbi:fungal hydrophobin-domain-containing protein [Crepidotus variabilis]|uniref:Hydrophobin n=1 Tax=Crepidotus variabilis TaxID=179855 RepID=A0A9P6E8M2_9AGAR|nr:fungal hydrophobin-domain-containing protein [Crepidotus variabilis]